MKKFQEVLQAAGYPINLCVLDFESFFDVGYRMGKFKDSISLTEYVMDDRFELTGLGEGYIDEHGKVSRNFYRPDAIRGYFDAAIRTYGLELEKCTVGGQILKFDCLIMKEHFGIVPKFTVDTLDLGNMHDPRGKHDLDAMGKMWGAPKSKGKTNEFKGIHASKMDFKKLEEYCLTDIDITTHLIENMLPVVMARPEIEMHLATHTLHMFLHESFDIDIDRAKIVQQRMTLEMAAAVTEVGKVMGEDFGHEDFSKPTIFVPMFTEILNKYGEKMPMKQNDKKTAMIPALAKSDQGMEELLCHPVEEISVLAKAKVAVGSWPGHIKKVKNTVLQAKARGNRLSGNLGYCRGKTWRWGGMGGINQHNMGGRGRAGHGTHPLITEVRGVYKAPEDYVLGILDFTSIEARNLAWQAGQGDLVEAFANGVDIYSEFATELFNAYVRKPRDSDPPALYALYELRRGFGKDNILGDGYGMGSNTYYRNCYINPALRPLFDSGKYDWDFCDRGIKHYRCKYSKIPDLWSKVEKAWSYVTRFRHEERIVNGNLRFYNRDDATFIELPSGRYIRYPGARVTGKGSLNYKWAKGIWGGYLTENIIQSESRDILGEAIVRLDKAGFWIALTVHDEIVLVLPINQSKEKAPETEKLIKEHHGWLEKGNSLPYDTWYWTKQDLNEPIKIMEEVPAWASGLPINVGGQLSERYCK